VVLADLVVVEVIALEEDEDLEAGVFLVDGVDDDEGAGALGVLLGEGLGVVLGEVVGGEEGDAPLALLEDHVGAELAAELGGDLVALDGGHLLLADGAADDLEGAAFGHGLGRVRAPGGRRGAARAEGEEGEREDGDQEA
jgi:hypothetical protein